MTIYDWVTTEKGRYEKPIELAEGWFWSFKDHVKRTILYKNSQFEESNESRDERPFKNIVRPILNLQYRTEGFDVKDIEIYVDSAENYYKSFLVKKFFDKWALENEIDTFIDDLVESYVDFGGVLVKNIDGARPEVVNLATLAFTDQTNLLKGAFAIEHLLTPDELRDMKGWGDPSNGATKSVDELVTIWEANRDEDEAYIKVYEVHGILPEYWLGGDIKEEKSTRQIQVIAYYKDQQSEEQGCTLFAKKEPKLPFKFLARDKVYGRALGFGGAEELFEAQVWTNWNEIQGLAMLKAASKIIHITDDKAFATRNKLLNVENNTVLDIAEGKSVTQLDTTPRNLVVFNDAVNRWADHAQQIGAAGEALLGESPSAGTPFKLQELVTMEAKGLHHYRQGKIAVFMDEIMREWIIPYIKREITNEQTFLSELDVEDLQSVSESLMRNKANKFAKKRILNGELVFPEETQMLGERVRTEFVKTNKKFIKILKDEFREDKLAVRTNIAGKQKNLALLTDKIVNIVRQFIATPQLRQDPEMVRLLNTILESSGLSPIMFGTTSPQQAQPTQATSQSTQPLEALGKTVREAVPA
jgi:hypothetical protein